MNKDYLNFFEKIDKLYPTGLVNGLKDKSPSLYEEAKTISKIEKTTVKNLFTENGYDYTRDNLKTIYKKDKKQLLKLFPNKVVKDLHEVDNKFYYKLLSHSKIEFDNIRDFIESLGFRYDVYNTTENVRDIKKELKKLYSNKKVVKLSMKDHNLYSRIYKIARRKGQAVDEFVKELGFEYI